MTPSELFGSNKTSPCVRQVYGISGSGKTYFLNQMIRQGIKSKDFDPMWRFIIFDVKHEGYADLVKSPATSTEEAIKNLKDERVAVIHPPIEYSQQELDDLIYWLFETAQRVENFGATLILEESSTFIRSSVGGIPASIKRMATQGRSLGLSMVLANQRSLSNKWTDTQSSSITMFRLAVPDGEMMKKRWGLKHDEIDQRLAEKKFSFAHYDLESLDLSYYAPLHEPKIEKPIPPVKKKETKPYPKLKVFGMNENTHKTLTKWLENQL